MRRWEWFIAIFLILIGLGCLTLSGTFLIHPGSVRFYVGTFFKVCVWMGLPVAIVGIIYLLLLWGKKKKGNKS